MRGRILWSGSDLALTRCRPISFLSPCCGPPAKNSGLFLIGGNHDVKLTSMARGTPRARQNFACKDIHQGLLLVLYAQWKFVVSPGKKSVRVWSGSDLIVRRSMAILAPEIILIGDTPWLLQQHRARCRQKRGK
jgi:hypothetical protein